MRTRAPSAAEVFLPSKKWAVVTAMYYFPHPGGVAFKLTGRTLFPAFREPGVGLISHNQPAGVLYPGENPFKF